MGRKSSENKKKDSQEKIENNSDFNFNLSSDAKRSIAAISLFVLSVVFVFGFLGNAGMLGKYINRVAGLTFGWGKWILPFVLVATGSILLFKKRALFYVTKIIGLAVAYFGFLGLFHIFFDSSDFLRIARDGAGGGYIGYFVSLALIEGTGKIAGVIILFASLLIGFIVALDTSIVSLFEKIIKIKIKKDTTTDQSIDYCEEDTKIDNDGNHQEEDDEIIEKKDVKKETDIKNNIKSIEFVEDAGSRNNVISEMKERAKSVLGKKHKEDVFQIRPINDSWSLPVLDLVEMSSEKAKGGDVEGNAEIIRKTLSHFGIEVELGDVKTGPTVTQYSFRPAVGVKLSKITGLSNDLALALAAHPIRIEAPIPGKSLIGIEVPNKSIATVRMRNILMSDEFKNRKSNLSIALGQDVSGNYIFGDLAKMPHLMIAGSTGSGKSVCINIVLLSLLYQNSPDMLRLILVDPKRVELSLYGGIPHLLSDVIVENKKVVNALKWAIGEMERRYRMLQDTGSRDIVSYNQKADAEEKRTYTDQETGERKEEVVARLPYIVIVIDELADLMAAHGKEVEGAIIRLAQMARAIGIHLIVSTQRPSVEVLTGLIKANITTRIAFKVATQIDSRTILDTGGAENLVGNGDMLFISTASPKPKRIQGVFVTENEVKRVVKHIRKQKLETEEDIDHEVSFSSGSSSDSGKVNFDLNGGGDESEDSMYEEAKNLVIETGKASTSFLQRRLRVGYSRAARLLDILEENGVVGPSNGAKPREVFSTGENSSEKNIGYENENNDQEMRDKWQI